MSVFAAVAITACGGSGASSSSSGSSSSSSANTTNAAATVGEGGNLTFGAKPTGSDTPKQGGTLTVAWLQEPPCLNADTATWVQVGYLSRQYADALTNATSSGKIVPWLATSWSISKNKLVYTFHLKPNVKFTDGTPLNAQAVVDNFKIWLNASSPTTYDGYAEAMIGDYYESATATGPLTFQLKLKKPDVFLLSELSQYAFEILSPTALAKGPAYNCEHPVGTGAFEVVKWNHGQDVVLKRNPNYNSWPSNASHKGPAYVNEVVWKFISDDTTRFAALTSGEADIAYQIPPVNWDEAVQKYQIEQHITGGSPYKIVLATKWGPFKNVLVRKAFGYATNRKAAVETVMKGEELYDGNGSLSPSSKPDWSSEVADYYSYDPKKAEQLLDEAGWSKKNSEGIREKDGQPLVIRWIYGENTNTNEDEVEMLEILQAEAKEVGFDVKLIPIPAAKEFSSTKNQGPNEWDAQMWYWVARSAETFNVVWRPASEEPGGKANEYNYGGYEDPRIGPLIKKLDETESEAKRAEISDQIQKILVDEDALVYGMTPLEVTLAINPKLHGVTIDPSIGEPVLAEAYFAK